MFETVLPEPKVIRNGLLDDGNVRKQRGKAGDITNEDPEKSEAINFYTDT